MGIQRAADGELLEPNLVREMLTQTREPGWMERQMELGPLLLQLMLSPWPAKRELLHRYPDLADPVRREMSRRVMLKAIPDGEARHQLTVLIVAHDELLDRCAEVLLASVVDGQDQHLLRRCTRSRSSRAGDVRSSRRVTAGRWSRCPTSSARQ